MERPEDIMMILSWKMIMPPSVQKTSVLAWIENTSIKKQIWKGPSTILQNGTTNERFTIKSPRFAD